ncbi:MAG TPA: hypothetical protein PK408_02190 [Treponemataceae bacterium]|nr:hypothetical protein [Treponemataceae bacterium]
MISPPRADNPNMKLYLTALAVFLPCFLFAQVRQISAEVPSASEVSSASEMPSASPDVSDRPAVPVSYRGITLGMELDAVKEALLADSVFGYRGERDVSLLPGENRTLIETSGSLFIRRAWFQFFGGKLYIMTFQLDTEHVDYYSLYTSLTVKYGEPSILDPSKSLWTDDICTLTLERPLTVKYVDKAVFESLVSASGTKKAEYDVSRENFINDF